MIDNVNGNCIENRDPFPSTESTDTSPPKISIVFLTTSRPTPRPETLEMVSAVENPDAKINSYTCLSVMFQLIVRSQFHF